MSYQLKEKIQNKTAKIGIIGMGYVGLPLAMEFSKVGFHVVGFDIDENKTKALNAGKSYIEDISDELVAGSVKKGLFEATTDFTKLKNVDCVSICVPTPLNKTHDPDVSYILESRERIRENIHPGMLIVLESTTYPGTTDELFIPMIEECGYTVGKDIYLAFSPERIDPSNPKFGVKNTPKIVGGYTDICKELVKDMYAAIVDQVVPVSSTKVAEMAKILENTYRAVNIGLVNEVAIMCRILGIDVWEVIDAAATKPFGFTPFYPGPGLGGHCIPVDPHYLAWKMKSLNYQARFVDLAAQVNTNMPRYVVNLVSDALNDHRKSLRGSKILILGLAYKADISDMRESPSIDVYNLLKLKGAEVDYYDPHVPSAHLDGGIQKSIAWDTSKLGQYDAVVITTHHKLFPIDQIIEYSKLVVDTRNATKGSPSSKVVRI